MQREVLPGWDKPHSGARGINASDWCQSGEREQLLSSALIRSALLQSHIATAAHATGIATGSAVRPGTAERVVFGEDVWRGVSGEYTYQTTEQPGLSTCGGIRARSTQRAT